MTEAPYRFEIFNKIKDFRGEVTLKNLKNLGYDISKIITCDNYLINAELTKEEAAKAAAALVNPVTQEFLINRPYMPDDFAYAVQISFLPGVTDNVARTVCETIEDLLKKKVQAVFSSVTFFFACKNEDIRNIAEELYNPLIQQAMILSVNEYTEAGGMGNVMPAVSLQKTAYVTTVSLDVHDDELLKIGKEGIENSDGTRRGPLALDLPSLKAIQNYFRTEYSPPRQPFDIELESIAQTWSEHCKHTIFAASIDEIKDGLYKHYIKAATNDIRAKKGKDDFCLSVFTDNSGGIAFDDDYIISDKVETHNSPSALDPYGGAITGIVGVNRDAIGFGMAALPIANRYGFCLSDPADASKLYRSKESGGGILSPRRIMEGVIKGVNEGGNTSGIPTPQGFLYFNKRYRGKPLVFVGTLGLAPRKVGDASFTEKRAMPGDHIVIAGGRVGLDGIHGATFSSESLNAGSPAGAVQIGDPITQKKLSDATVKEARDMGLYHSVTDNGAGGLSCSVAEMAREAGGFIVDIDSVPLKYPGLAPWQIWISESQERMTFAVPKDKLDLFLKLMESRGVEACAIGFFTAETRGVITHNGKTIFDMNMDFLHNGLPQKVLSSEYVKPTVVPISIQEPTDLSAVFVKMLSRLNTGSFAFISSQYDHEVQGSSLLKPLQGKGLINGNASAIKPLFTSSKAAVLSQGLYPTYSELDPYAMAACCIDTAVRNLIAAGGSLDKIALLDNFCWCDSTNPKRLGQLKEAARGCYDFAVAYGTPFISGKDSMFNDFNGFDEFFNEISISVPPTLLISSLGVIDDWQRCQSIDFKQSGDAIYLLGETKEELGGSEYALFAGDEKGGAVPQVDAVAFIKLYRALEKAIIGGLVASSISIERGGLAVALGKSAMAGMLGCSISLENIAAGLRTDYCLFSESQGRTLVSVAPQNTAAFEACFSGLPCCRIGVVNDTNEIAVADAFGKPALLVYLDELSAAHKSVFEGM